MMQVGNKVIVDVVGR